MPSLSDRLKALGVQVGKDNSLSPPRLRYPIEKVVEGQIVSTLHGQTYIVEQRYPVDHPYGDTTLAISAPMEMIAAWARDERVASTPLENFAFIDTETTGLAGGSGTYAFLIGVGLFAGDEFRLVQIFMRDPIEEPAALSYLEGLLASCETIVSFNGKAFDLPLLQARYITNGWPPPLGDVAHLDLLHLARRLWRQRLPSRALGYLEEHIIGETRTEDDTPGWMIPQMYFDYLRSRDARPLKGVFYHNAMDILTMAALTERMAHMLAEPLGDDIEHALDRVALGKLYEDLGHPYEAVQIFERSLEQDLPAEARRKTMQRLSFLHKRRGEMPQALSLWWQAAADREIYAHIELAKYYEHKAADLAEASRWTQAALAILKMPDTPRYARIQWEEQLEHRLKRLARKLARQVLKRREEGRSGE